MFPYTIPALLAAALMTPPAGSAELPFEVATVGVQAVPREQVFDGVIEAVNRSTVSAQVSGRIEAIHFDVDDYVEQGDVLIEFRNTEPRARADQAQAQLAEAEARDREAAAEHQRIQRVYERKLVARAALDKAAAERKAAAARLEAARAALTGAREQLEHTLVRAPYSGIVTERHVEVGETATPGQALMTGLSLDALRVVVEVPQSLIGTVRRERRARILLPDAALESDALTLFPYADPDSHTFKVRVALPSAQPGLYPGMLIKVAFRTGTAQALRVPARAVAHRSEVTGVYVVAPDGTVYLRQVRLGHAGDDWIEVLAGLADGEQVALDPIRAGIYLKERAAAPAQ
jgi:RND family efflux transporter MFP subunit